MPGVGKRLLNSSAALAACALAGLCASPAQASDLDLISANTLEMTGDVRLVAADGVEETAQLMELRTHGCSSIQGFLFAEPMTAADVERLFGTEGMTIQDVA